MKVFSDFNPNETTIFSWCCILTEILRTIMKEIFKRNLHMKDEKLTNLRRSHCKIRSSFHLNVSAISVEQRLKLIRVWLGLRAYFDTMTWRKQRLIHLYCHFYYFSKVLWAVTWIFYLHSGLAHWLTISYSNNCCWTVWMDGCMDGSMVGSTIQSNRTYHRSLATFG